MLTSWTTHTLVYYRWSTCQTSFVARWWRLEEFFEKVWYILCEFHLSAGKGSWNMVTESTPEWLWEGYLSSSATLVHQTLAIGPWGEVRPESLLLADRVWGLDSGKGSAKPSVAEGALACRILARCFVHDVMLPGYSSEMDKFWSYPCLKWHLMESNLSTRAARTLIQLLH